MPYLVCQGRRQLVLVIEIPSHAGHFFCQQSLVDEFVNEAEKKHKKAASVVGVSAQLTPLCDKQGKKLARLSMLHPTFFRNVMTF